MKYNVIQFITNTKGQYVASVLATYEDKENAIVKYHSTLANLHNADDCLYASVKIEDEYGMEFDNYREFVDHHVEETETAEE